MLWQELDLNLEETGKCPEDNAQYQRKVESERVFEFLAGLNHELDDMRGRVLIQRPLPSIWEVFPEVRREEQRRKVMLKTHGAGLEESALMTHGPSGPNNSEGAGLATCGPQNNGPKKNGLIVSIAKN